MPHSTAMAMSLQYYTDCSLPDIICYDSFDILENFNRSIRICTNRLYQRRNERTGYTFTRTLMVLCGGGTAYQVSFFPHRRSGRTLNHGCYVTVLTDGYL